jgi:type I restriction enzyme M protein
VNDAMRAIEAKNEELKDFHPKTYNPLENDTLVALLRNFSRITMDIEGGCVREDLRVLPR